MTELALLEELKKFIEEKTKDINLPTSALDGEETIYRAPAAYKQRVPHSSRAKEYVPYVLIQLVNGSDGQVQGSSTSNRQLVRFIFCVYNDDEEEGSAILINLLETVRIALLKKIVIGGCFKLDLKSKLERLIYPDNTAPYYAGELVGTFEMPAIEREVDIHGFI